MLTPLFFCYAQPVVYWVAFFFSLLLFLLFPFLPLAFFVPPIIFSLERARSLYIPFLILSGLLLDCFYWSVPFGTNLLSYLLIGWIVYHRFRWLRTNHVTFGIKVWLFCTLEVILRWSVLFSLHLAPQLSLRWLFFNLLFFPLLNACYGIFFSGIFEKLQRATNMGSTTRGE